ncbi:MAG: hypothetical protein RJA22_178 [Verrucomicrobiota bacterium]|jgi:hypothetical protein
MTPPAALALLASVLLAALPTRASAADKGAPASTGKTSPPQILALQPLVTNPGATQIVTLRGQHLTNATEVRILPAQGGTPLAATIQARRRLEVGKNADSAKLGEHQLEIRVTVPPGSAAATNRIEVVSAAGTSAGRPWVVLPADQVAREQEPNGGFSQAQPLTPGRTLAGAMADPGDVDVFRVGGRRGQRLTVRVWAEGGGSALDAHLTLHDDRGRVLATADDQPASRDAVLAAVLPADGDYCVSLVDAYDRGGALYGYLLRMDLAAPGAAKGSAQQ